MQKGFRKKIGSWQQEVPAVGSYWQPEGRRDLPLVSSQSVSTNVAATNHMQLRQTRNTSVMAAIVGAGIVSYPLIFHCQF
ncbi:hypothetical protein QQF64_023878 [Cirrhinus molitorella]|uniref:Uncharacterized protein n=1 Tax=Cirrhinus molitorella TaxID=172907 RepID=A0ABR3NJU7_9TELE